MKTTTPPSNLRAIRIIEILALSVEPLTFSELLQQTTIPKTSLIRQLKALVQGGYITQLPAQIGYTLAPRTMHFSARALRSTHFTKAATRILQQLVEQINESCNLTVLVGDSVQYLAREESHSSWSLQLHVQPGTPVPLHCTASGKLFLANLPLIEQKNYLKRLDLTAYTPNSITNSDALKKDLDNTYRQGFGIDNEEFVQGMVAMAIPIYSPHAEHEVIAAIACHAVTARTTLSQLLRYRSLMSSTAKELSALFI